MHSRRLFSSEAKRWVVALVLAVAIEAGVVGVVFASWEQPPVPPPKSAQSLVSVTIRERPGVASVQAGEVEAPLVKPKPRARKKSDVAVARVVDPVESAPVAEAVDAIEDGAAVGEDVGSGVVAGSGDSAGQGEGTGEPAGALEGIDLSRYGVLVLSQLQANRRYPPQAARMRLQGTVVVELVVAADGSLVGVRMVSSSGHAVLDDEALRLVRTSAPFPALPGGKATATFSVPIRYGG